MLRELSKGHLGALDEAIPRWGPHICSSHSGRSPLAAAKRSMPSQWFNEKFRKRTKLPKHKSSGYAVIRLAVQALQGQASDLS
jgi:hypothetical protein